MTTPGPRRQPPPRPLRPADISAGTHSVFKQDAVLVCPATVLGATVVHADGCHLELQNFSAASTHIRLYNGATLTLRGAAVSEALFESIHGTVRLLDDSRVDSAHGEIGSLACVRSGIVATGYGHDETRPPADSALNLSVRDVSRLDDQPLDRGIVRGARFIFDGGGGAPRLAAAAARCLYVDPNLDDQPPTSSLRPAYKQDDSNLLERSKTFATLAAVLDTGVGDEQKALRATFLGYEARIAASSSRATRRILSIYRLLGYGVLLHPPFRCYLACVAIAGAFLAVGQGQAGSMKFEISVQSTLWLVEVFSASAVGPLSLASDSLGKVVEDAPPILVLACRLFVGVPLSVGFVALVRFLRLHPHSPDLR